MVLRFAYVTSPQQWSKADASGWRAPTAPCLRGLACVEVRSCDGASRSHRHTEGLWTRQARDDPGVCGIADSNTHRVQARVPAAARGGGGARPGRGQGRRGRWKKPLEFPLLISYTLAKDRGKNRLNFLYSFVYSCKRSQSHKERYL